MEEPTDLVVTPCLSSARRRFKIWIFEMPDVLAIVGWAIFGQYLINFWIHLLVLIGLLVLIAFYKYGKPDGYLMHLIGFHLRTHLTKPGNRRKVPVFFDPRETPL